MYDQSGKIDFSDISVSSSTDTIDLRASIPNPARGTASDAGGNRTLVDGGFVTVILQSTDPVQSITVPRAAVLADQQGFYVYVIDAKNVAERRNITMGQSPDPLLAVISTGLKAGEQVVADGVQRVHPGAPVKPVPYQAPVMPPSANGDGSAD
jgi:membrane fusion protein (multidrug efflux system)